MGRDVDGKAYAYTNIAEPNVTVSDKDKYQLINKSYADYNYVKAPKNYTEVVTTV